MEWLDTVAGIWFWFWGGYMLWKFDKRRGGNASFLDCLAYWWLAIPYLAITDAKGEG